MLKMIVWTSASLVFAAGAALADAEGDLSNPSTTGTEAMEQTTPQRRDAGRNGLDDRVSDDDDSSALGTMGTGATGTTGGMGATTGTDTIEDRDDDTDQ